MSLGKVWGLLKQTWQEFNEDKVPRLGAALAYYTLFSLAPLLVIAIAIAGLVFGDEAARGQIVGTIGGLVGQQGAEAIQSMIQNASKPSTGILATIIGFVTLFLGASGVFGELQQTLNTIWEVTPKPTKGIMGMLKTRIFSFTLVLGTGFLLLVSLVISAGLAALGKYMSGLVPGLDFLWQIVNFVVSFGVTTLLFALIYKIVPDAEIEWRDVWVGAAFTALLFSVGRFAIGFYLARSATASAYGAAGSLVILLLWLYYSAQIMFFGAEFTQVYANKYGSRLQPAPDALPMTEEARLEQGMPRQNDVKEADKRGGDTSVEEVAEERERAGVDGRTQTPEEREQARADGKTEKPAEREPRPTAQGQHQPAHVATSDAAPTTEAPSGPYRVAGLLAAAIVGILGVVRGFRQNGNQSNQA